MIGDEFQEKSSQNRQSFNNCYFHVITAQDLIPTDISSNKVESVRIPNAFIAYRMALVRQLKSQKVACHRSNVSSLASRLWAEEPEDVKNTYRKMATDAQLLHNQARGLTFLSYEQSTSSDNVMQDETSSENINNHSTTTQDIEAELLALLNLQSLHFQPTLQQTNPIIPSPMYFDNNPPTTTSVSASFDHYNNLGNNYNGNFIGNMTGKGVYERYLEQRIQILEQQMALFYQLYYGVV
ncbi:kinase-like domain-containing protein [Rhizophagus clarus]|uniref:Kinase-like domain-containing protein n=1 Tax=Rhizophagus clarus TaxID=94130 RepID=A0A8H3QJL5_9GLOM|nr:kinase-like domain-containing protein [Rhizophagus clarus]